VVQGTGGAVQKHRAAATCGSNSRVLTRKRRLPCRHTPTGCTAVHRRRPPLLLAVLLHVSVPWSLLSCSRSIFWGVAVSGGGRSGTPQRWLQTEHRRQRRGRRSLASLEGWRTGDKSKLSVADSSFSLLLTRLPARERGRRLSPRAGPQNPLLRVPSNSYDSLECTGCNCRLFDNLQAVCRLFLSHHPTWAPNAIPWAVRRAST